MVSDEKEKEDEEAQQAAADEPTPAAYVRAAKAYIRNARQKDAFRIMQQAFLHFPNEPAVLSYFGCLQAQVDKKHRSGVEACKKAITMIGREKPAVKGKLYPVFYLNLGRAYIAAGKKKDALEAFAKGLQYDRGNYELKKELRGMGERKAPPVPFLDRRNPINKYIGIVLSKGKQDTAKSGRRGTRVN
jgi:tetratricopeptide (TPR) repeat protein